MSTRPRRAGARRGAQILMGLVTSLALFAGCRSLLSIEQLDYDPALNDGGTDGGDELSCATYCDLIQSVCTGGNVQFSSVAACLGLCSTFPEGSLDDDSGHTLGCRIHLLQTSQAMIESSDCAAAGPGGNGVCGTNCDAYCSGMAAVCPQSFESPGDCTDACAPLLECGLYSVPSTTPDNPSIQCRLYHLSAAAINLLSQKEGELTDSQIKHCPHAAGQTECIAVADPMCP